MCFRSPPPPPPPPEEEPVAPPPEKTADQVVTGTQRTPTKKKRGSGVKEARRRGTSSLRIPLLDEQTDSGNLRTPM